MANLRRKVAQSIDGLFFVDDTCIDCDTCRELAPMVFGDAPGSSAVLHQPVSSDDILAASRALVACPVGSIGTTEKIDLASAFATLPLEIEPNVYYNGFASPDSFGASSYFIRHPDGNWLIDSPKYQQHLVKRFDEWGGISYVFLSHQDDIADADRYASHFGAKRIIHRAELRAQPEAELVLDGEEPVAFGNDFLVIPTPGHTRGHCVLLFNGILFSGDHLWWSRRRGSLNAGRSVCWYSWSEQRRSMQKLLRYDIRAVLPGHGERVIMGPEGINVQLEQLIERM